MKTGEKIRNARKAAGLTQKELAERLNVVQTVISEYELGKRNPKLPTLLKISKAIGCSLYELIGGDDYQKPTKEEYFYLWDNYPETELLTSDSLIGNDEDLLKRANKLNREGRYKAAVYMNDLSQIPAYRNDVTE